MAVRELLRAGPLLLLLACAGFRDVASFARDVQTEFDAPTAVQLNNGTHLLVAFSTVRAMGPLTLTRTDTPFRWRLSELP